ncbi:DUF1365 domain-containing protein [Gordonia sp. CPCC 206044]|uniref:DUF1365 domain-containing protein n=1 Tax=Gordonia sp. CPCC 206044 TaxID=3140793 RepID=UPI003AF33E2B
MIGEVPTPSVVRTRIRHVRTSPVRHAFTHRSASWLVDIDEIPRLALAIRQFARFRPEDHFPEPVRHGESLRDRLNRHVLSAGVDVPSGRVLALMSPRVLGYVFNPLSVFWCHDADGALAYALVEVHNTYGQRHSYFVRPDEHGHARVDKAFYVSPFNDVDGSYQLRVPLPDPDGRVAIAVTLQRAGAAPFVATLVGTARPSTSREILRAQVGAPLAPLVVAARIRWHGIALWCKGLHVLPRPPHSANTSVSTRLRRSA